MYNALRLSLLMLVIFQAGCISYSHNKLADVPEWPIRVKGSSPFAAVNLVTQYHFNGSKKSSQPKLQKDAEAIIRSQYSKSGLFKNIYYGRSDKADIYIDVAFINDEKGILALAFLSGLSLMVIPGTYDNVLTMKTTFRNSQRQVIGKIEKTETVTTWAQILLIFAMPFNISLDEVIANMTRHTLSEALEKGYLNPAAQPL